MLFIFPPYLNRVSALPCKTDKSSTIASFHSLSYDYSCSVENGHCWAFLRWTWVKSQRQVLPECSSIAAMLPAIRYYYV